jgi:long-chain acyl-CoA synthetase
MAHIAERVATHYLHVDQRLVVTSCPTLTQLFDHVRDVRPHLFLGVPRVWETARKAIESLAQADPAGRQALEEAVELGRRVVRARAAGRRPDATLSSAWERADAETMSVVRSLMGLDRCEVAISSAAPLGAELAEYFLALGLPLSELYGLSESCGPISWRPDHVHPGASGAPIPGCEVRLAADGEILARGGNIFAGYVDDRRATADVLDDEGFLHTGDIGHLDADGCLVVTGRKRELIVTPGGTNVAPDALETALRRSPLIEHACVLGDRRPYLVALVTLDADIARQWSQQRGGNAATRQELVADPFVAAEIDRVVAQVNRALPPEQRIHRHMVLQDRWRPDSDELTPTDKLRREGIALRYAAEIDELY